MNNAILARMLRTFASQCDSIGDTIDAANPGDKYASLMFRDDADEARKYADTLMPAAPPQATHPFEYNAVTDSCRVCNCRRDDPQHAGTKPRGPCFYCGATSGHKPTCATIRK